MLSDAVPRFKSWDNMDLRKKKMQVGIQLNNSLERIYKNLGARLFELPIGYVEITNVLVGT